MVTVSCRSLPSLLAPILVPAVFSVLAPNPIEAGETPSFLLATAAPTERLSPPVTWLDDLEHRLTTYFTKKYPAYDFSPYAQELDRIRGASAQPALRMNASAAIADVWARGAGPEARGKSRAFDGKSSPLAPGSVPLAYEKSDCSRSVHE